MKTLHKWFLRSVGGLGLFNEEEVAQSTCCEGFPVEWVHGSYAQDKQCFTVCIGTEHNLYTFLLLATRGAS